MVLSTITNVDIYSVRHVEYTVLEMGLFSSAALVFTLAFLLRAVLLFYGIYQDAHSALKYTDIDYYVFTDAARAVSRSGSPYDRATYRYTPLLAWILLPTSWSDRNGLWFHSGKALFAMSDLVAGWFILILLRKQGLEKSRALKYASVWLLNPMVANISTRGSSEGLLCVLVMANLWAFETQRIALTGILLGLSVHFKIYPFVYGASMLWALNTAPSGTGLSGQIQRLLSREHLTLITTSLAVFSILNIIMYSSYGGPFFEHTFLHHLTRIDHRHNFSPYNTLLYLSSSRTTSTPTDTHISFERLAFLPQLALSTILIPVSCASKTTIPSTLLAQTLAFVTFNKVCTSQYFLWYLIFLPLYLPHSSLITNSRLGLTTLVLWVAGQALWLQQGFNLEFLGRSTFVPGLWIAGLLFFGINCWILGIVVSDIVSTNTGKGVVSVKAEKKKL